MPNEETQTPIVETSAEASKGSFQSVVAVEGVPRPLKLIDAKQANQRGKFVTRVEIGLDEATILEMLPGEDEPELEDGQANNDHHQDPGQSCRVTHVKVGKGRPVDVQRYEPGRKGRPSTSGHKGYVKHAQRTDNAHDQVEKDDRAEHGNGDVPKLHVA